MMNCRNCGAEYVDGAKFCENCGQPYESLSNSNNTNASSVNSVPLEDSNNTLKKKKRNKLLIPIICSGIGILVTALLAAILITIYIKENTVNLNDYLLIQTSGYDGYGEAYVDIDWTAIEADYGSKITFSEKAEQQFGGFLSYNSVSDVMQTFVTVEIEQTDYLSNGQEIKYTWYINDDVYDYVDCRLSCKDGVYKVYDLQPVVSFDAFADLEVIFSGISPNGYATINYNGTEMSNEAFTCDKTSGLENGETVIVRLDENMMEQYAKNNGIVPQEKTKEYYVDGLPRYISGPDEIDNNTFELMKGQGSDDFRSRIANRYKDGEEIKSVTYIGTYFLTSKNQYDMEEANKLYLVYKIQVHNFFSTGEDYWKQTYDEINEVYWYIEYDNILIDTNNRVYVDATDYATPKDDFYVGSGIASGFYEKGWTYDGYESLDELYDAVITRNLDSYVHVDDVDDSTTPTPKSKQIECISADASDYHTDDRDGKEYLGTFTIDGKLDTAWNVRGGDTNDDPNTNGVGQYIEFFFPVGTKLSSIKIHPGFCDGTKTFFNNYTPTVLTISSGDKEFEVNLEEYAKNYEKAVEGYTYSFGDDWLVLEDGCLRITIDSVWSKNKKWQDCCISEVYFYGELGE